MRIDQWVPALHRGDAIGDSARLMRDAFRSWGHQADVYALSLDDDLRGDGLPWSAWTPGSSSDAVILHYALPSPLTAALAAHHGRRLLIHHNITPPEFFAGYDEEMVRICELGRAELGTLRDQVDLALGDSEFNRQELEAAGFARTGVLPIYLDFARYAEPSGPVVARELADGRTNVLFVGRLVPNKRQDDLIRMCAYWKRYISPEVRLVLVGKPPRRRGYLDALHSLMSEAGLTPWDVVFTGHVDHRDLLACYRTAQVFVSMSEHEGFGVPLVESMILDVPVLAYRAGAVPFTLGGSGVLFDEKQMDVVAEMASRLASAGPLREGVLRAQRRRRDDFAPQAVEAALKAYVDSL
jgi:glycosyltransferase involved in cell wall biosynthesis